MNKQELEQTQENLGKLLERHWLHCQHVESERSWFMNAYAAVVGGVVAFIIGSGVKDLSELEGSSTYKFFVTFLLVFTIFGFFHTMRWTYAFECHRNRVNKLVKLIGLMGRGYTPKIVWKDLDMRISPMKPLPNRQRIWKSLKELRKFRQTCSKLWHRLKKFNEIFRTRYWFPLIYFVVLILCAIVFPPPFRWAAIGCLVLALWLGIGFLFSKPK